MPERVDPGPGGSYSPFQASRPLLYLDLLTFNPVTKELLAVSVFVLVAYALPGNKGVWLGILILLGYLAIHPKTLSGAVNFVHEWSATL